MNLDMLNDMQKKAVLHTEGPLLLLAGAGSGKTRVLTHRMAYMISNGVSPFNIIAITFTNKAAKEMKHRVEALVENGADIWVSTFHSSCVRILRQEITRLGYDRSFSIYDTDDCEKLMKGCIKELNVNDKQYPHKTVLHEIGKAKDELVSPQIYEQRETDNYRKQVVAKLYTLYQRKLVECNALDFDDIIFKTVEIFSKFPEVLEKYQNRFKYISVDEYQDTNFAQYELIRLLSEKHRNLCVVGDDDQSIYGWRGADIRNILEFEKDYPDAAVIKLEQNYRSSKNILDAANYVISNNRHRKSKKLWTEFEQGEKIKLHCAANDSLEAQFIADEITRVNAAGKFSDNAVLYRTNAQSRSIEDQFLHRSIPYRIFGGIRFYQRKEVKDVLAYLRAINNPYDEVSLARIINYPKRGIGETTVEKISAYAKEMDLPFYSALCICDEVITNSAKIKKLNEFVTLIEKYKLASRSMPVGDFVNAVIEETHIREALAIEVGEEAADRIANIDEFLTKAFEFSTQTESPYLQEFLEDVALVADIDNYDDTEDAVALMTIHSAKGLEFPNVFLTGMEEGIFPGMMSIMSPEEEQLEEERRLCYVAVTRAKSKLFITHALERRRHGEINYNMPSRFLKEIPSSLIISIDGEGNIKKTVSNKKPVQLQKSTAVRGRETVSRQKDDSIRIDGVKKQQYVSVPVKNITLDYTVGDNVTHIKYGSGTVTDIRPAGADYEVTVEFPYFAAKKFMSSFAKLVKQ